MAQADNTPKNPTTNKVDVDKSSALKHGEANISVAPKPDQPKPQEQPVPNQKPNVPLHATAGDAAGNPVNKPGMSSN